MKTKKLAKIRMDCVHGEIKAFEDFGNWAYRWLEKLEELPTKVTFELLRISRDLEI